MLKFFKKLLFLNFKGNKHVYYPCGNNCFRAKILSMTKTRDILQQPPNSRGIGLTFPSRMADKFEIAIKEKGATVVERLVNWQCLLKIINELEEIYIENEEDSLKNECSDQHEIILGAAIFLGKYLLKLQGIDKALEEISCTKGYLKSKIQMLEYKNNMWHGELSKDQEKADKILASIFCDA